MSASIKYGIIALLLTGISWVALHDYAAKTGGSSEQKTEPGRSVMRPVDIRVRNGTTRDFRRVIVGGRPYGDLRAGESSDYLRWPRAYPYSSVALLADGKPMEIVPVDYVGEPLLKEGRYTYVLEIRESDLWIRAERDK